MTSYVKDVYCAGTLKKGRLTGKPCHKFLGALTEPYRDVICDRCGHKNLAPLNPGVIYEWADEPPKHFRREILVQTEWPADIPPNPSMGASRRIVLRAEKWHAENGQTRWAWVVC